jgi:hypothetical protein
MAKPSGQAKTAKGFGSEHEANAWIVQAKRMKRDAAPWTPLVPRKAGATTASLKDDGEVLLERSSVKP